MTDQPIYSMASIHEVWRLIMRSIVFTKCKERKEEGSPLLDFGGHNLNAKIR